MEIKTAELRTIFDKLLSHLEETGNSSVEVSVDYYWNVSHEQRYDPYIVPNSMDLGQLSDDWAELEKIAQGEASVVNYALVWLGAVLRRLGEQCVG
jgi:hypothetical protein